MKTGKRILSCLFALSICAAMSVVAFAASESIDNGSGSWYGGIDNHTIYSKVWDHVVDGRRYNVTVWVQDDNGDKDSVTGTTNGVDAAGEVKVTKTASYDHVPVWLICSWQRTHLLRLRWSCGMKWKYPSNLCTYFNEYKVKK